MNEQYQLILKKLTSKGQPFEYKEVTNTKGIKYREYVHFPETLKGFFELGLLHEEKDWLIYDDERFSYKAVYTQAAQFGNALIDLGIKKGDRVAICMKNNPEYVIAYIGILGIGAVCVPLNSWWVGSEINYAIDHSDAKLILADKERLKSIDSIKNVIKVSTSYTDNNEFINFREFVNKHNSDWPEVDLNKDDHATIYYTSGSTGKPKGVLSSHKGIISGMFSWACYSTILNEINSQNESLSEPVISSELGILLCVPLFHVTGSHAGLLMSILVGRKIVMMDKWDAGVALKLIEKESLSDITGVPTQTWELLNHPDKNNYDLSSLKTLGGGGGPRPAEHVKKIDDEFIGRPAIGYGLSETNAIGTLCNGDEYVNNPLTAGRIVPPLTDIKIIDKEWNEVAMGQVGEIAIKSSANMIGYWKDDEATKSCVNEEGWFRTGDLGKFEEHLLFIVDRVKDLVIRGGENIACFEVEEAIYQNNHVMEASVFGIPDKRLGEVLCAAIFLKTRKSISSDDLKEFLSDKIAAFKIPEHVIIFESKLPRLASEKFNKPNLREIFIKKYN